MMCMAVGIMVYAKVVLLLSGILILFKPKYNMCMTVGIKPKYNMCMAVGIIVGSKVVLLSRILSLFKPKYIMCMTVGIICQLLSFKPKYIMRMAVGITFDAQSILLFSLSQVNMSSSKSSSAATDMSSEPSSVHFKTMPSLNGDTPEAYRAYLSSLRHHAMLGGTQYGEIMDLSNSSSKLSKKHDQVLFAVMAISIGNGAKCPSAKEIIDKVDESTYSARDALERLTAHYGSAGALRQSILLTDLLELDYESLGHVEYKRKFNECVRLLSSMKFPPLLLRGLVLKALPKGVTDQGHSWFNFKLLQNSAVHENDSLEDLFKILDDVHK